MFRNLKAEVARNDLEYNEIAEFLGISDRTLRSYLSGKKRIPFSFAKKIKDHYFPSLTLEYLFEFPDEDSKAS